MRMGQIVSVYEESPVKPFATVIFLLSLLSILSWGQESSDFRLAETNVWGAEYPRVDAGRVQIRVKAPDATKVKLNFWSGPKVKWRNNRTDSGP